MGIFKKLMRWLLIGLLVGTIIWMSSGVYRLVSKTIRGS